MREVLVLNSIFPFAAESRVWFVDIWGVMHNGVAPYARAVKTCSRFRELGGTVILVSNAPRPCQSVIEQLDRIGVARAAYDTVVSSGDVSRSLIADLKGQRVLHIGPERDKPLFVGLNVAETAEITAADAVVCTGLYDDESESPADYAQTLAALKERELPMICANPDHKVERGNRIIYCAGAVAGAYEAIGGNVVYAGKPYLPIYEVAVETASALQGRPVAKTEIVAIGDGIATDIAGAATFGVPSIYIASALHGHANEPLSAMSERLFGAEGAARPLAIMSELT
jgi:HAD superfamily hydrolase (TIGR01459 family)